VPAERIYLAPMMECTDRHFRFLIRVLSKHVRLYTEMITAQAIVYGNRNRLLDFDASEHPVVLQLGGSDPELLGRAAVYAAEWGYDEVNLNCGCPSDRVKSGRFGACLMAEPEVVARCVESMAKASGLRITVKTRIGIDDLDSYEHLCRFIDVVAKAGCPEFSIHARKAWLKGLSPKENREVPPLRYDVAADLVRDFPDLRFALNGGITTLDQCEAHLKTFAAVMIGREAYRNPMMLAEVDRRFHGAVAEPISREAAVTTMLPYVSERIAEGERLHFITRHLNGLWMGARGGKAFRRALGQGAAKAGEGAEVIERALVAGLTAAEKADDEEEAWRAQGVVASSAEDLSLRLSTGFQNP